MSSDPSRALTPDPIDGTRDGWKHCWECQAIKPPEHVHGDPLEKLTHAELLMVARAWAGEGHPPIQVLELLELAAKR